MVCCMTWTEHSVPFGDAPRVHGVLLTVVDLFLFIPYLSLHASILHDEFLFFLTIIGDFFVLVVVSWFVLILIIWRNPILIKFVLFSPFLILLVADPSFPLYLIVSCGKFLEFSGCLFFVFFFKSAVAVEIFKCFSNRSLTIGLLAYLSKEIICTPMPFISTFLPAVLPACKGVFQLVYFYTWIFWVQKCVHSEKYAKMQCTLKTPKYWYFTLSTKAILVI